MICRAPRLNAMWHSAAAYRHPERRWPSSPPFLSKQRESRSSWHLDHAGGDHLMPSCQARPLVPHAGTAARGDRQALCVLGTPVRAETPTAAVRAHSRCFLPVVVPTQSTSKSRQPSWNCRAGRAGNYQEHPPCPSNRFPEAGFLRPGRTGGPSNLASKWADLLKPLQLLNQSCHQFQQPCFCEHFPQCVSSF